MVNSFASVLLEGLLPNACTLCGLRAHEPVPLCLPCKAEMTLNSKPCGRCGLSLPASAQAGPCGACIAKPPVFRAAVTPWLYDEYLAYLIRQWKFHRRQHLTGLLAQLWLERCPNPPEIDLLVPVPLHWRRRWQRGYNQAELLARELLRRRPGLAGAGLDPGLLRRGRATPEQSGLDARQRASNLRGAFTVRGRCDNLRIALVDDVLTTGATSAEAASALLTAGADEVHIWCLARTPSPEH